MDFATIGYDGCPPILEPVAGLTARERAAKNCPKRNANHCVVCWLLHQRLISKTQHATAERLQNDHANSEVSGIRGVNLLTPGCRGSGGPAVVAQTKLDSSKAKATALIFAGASGAALLTAVVIEDLSLGAAADLLGWHEKGALPALRVALDTLTVIYAFRLEVSGARDGVERSQAGKAIAGSARAHRTRVLSGR